MKKIVNVNIGGVPFTLDEDAYRLLEQYLNTLRAIYHDGDEEMVTDIEARIAELLLADVAESRIVTLTDIQREIAVIGDPNDFDDEEQPEPVLEEKVTVNIEPPAPQLEHKLYRDPRNKMIAGVCSGIAAYNHMSVNTVRILTVAAFFLTLIFPLGASLSLWIVPIVYACFWIAVPEARTPLQFMQLYGESGSMADVAKAVNNQYAAPPAYIPDSESPAGFWTVVGNIIIAMVKGFFAFIAIVIGVPVIIGLILAALVFIFWGIVTLIGAVGHADYAVWFPEMAEVMRNLPTSFGWMLTLVLAALGAVLIPAWFLIRSVFHLEERFPLSRTSRIVWLVLWILCILIGITAGTAIGTA